MSVLKIPPRDAHAPARLIDLSPYFDRSLDCDPSSGWFPAEKSSFQALPRGVRKLPGSGATPFDIRGMIELDHLAWLDGPMVKTSATAWGRRKVLKPERIPGIPPAVRGIHIAQKCSRLHFLHGAWFPETDWTAIGAYVIHYTDGQRAEIPIRYGEEVRDSFPSEDPDYVSGAKVAWTGPHPDLGKIRILSL
jgi:hypothetical protein